MFNDIQKDINLRKTYDELQKRMFGMEQFIREAISTAYDNGYKNAETDTVAEMIQEAIGKLKNE